MSWETGQAMVILVTRDGKIVGGAGSGPASGETLRLLAGVPVQVAGSTTFTACTAGGEDTGHPLPAGAYELVGWMGDGELPDGSPAYIASAPVTVTI
jgi:hypothetical protein